MSTVLLAHVDPADVENETLPPETAPRSLTPEMIREAILNQKPLRKAPPKWRTKFVVMDQKSTCYWCGKILDIKSKESELRVEVDHLIRPDAGGGNDPSGWRSPCA